ncbi:MAG: peptidase, partial [Firmicutes bacterium]|nr:peptidase [Bacillota bacterium]
MTSANKIENGGKPMTDWLNDWIEDLDWLASELPRKHMDLFHQVTEHAFLAQINHLKADLFDCDNTMVMTRLMAIIASIGDAHTALVPAVNRYLPFEFYWFAEGLHIIGATSEQQDWLGARVIAIESQPIADVIDALSEIIAHENKSFLAAQLPAFLAAADLLYGLEICDHPGTVQLTLMKRDGKPTRVTVATVGLNDRASDMIRLEEIAAGPAESNGTILPLYRQHRNQSFWFTPVEPELLYVQYNTCKELTDSPIAASFAVLLATISNQHPAKII